MNSIEQLQNQGGLVADDLVKRTGQWRGKDVEFYVRRLAFGDIDRVYNADNPEISQSAELIAMAIRLGDDGTEALSYQQAYKLDTELAMLFSDHIEAVNRVGDEETQTDPKASGRKKSSGSSSRKSSAARSGKPSKG